MANVRPNRRDDDELMEDYSPRQASSKRNLIIFVVVIAALILGAIWLGMNLGKDNPSGASRYSAVYLSTGDIYFGELSWLPWPTLRNVWYLQRTTDANNQPTVGIAPLKSVFWGPTDKLRLNPKDIIVTTHLRNDSEVVKILKDPAAAEQTNAQPQTQQQTLPQGQATQPAPAATEPVPAESL